MPVLPMTLEMTCKVLPCTQ
jgi:hypothetical protein